MNLGYGTPSKDLLRELRQVRTAALAVVKTLGETNALPLNFPTEVLVDVCDALSGLEAGTAENCRPTLEYARNKIPEIRRSFFLLDEDDDQPIELPPDEPRLYRGMPLDVRLNTLIGSVTTALDEYRVQAQERFDDTVRGEETILLEHPSETIRPSADATLVIETSARALSEITSHRLNETPNGEVLARRLADSKNLATAARSQIRSRRIVRRWFEGISHALRELPSLIGKAGRAIKVGTDVADVLSDWWTKTEHELLTAAINQVRGFGEALEQISEALRRRSPNAVELIVAEEGRSTAVLDAEAEVERLLKAGEEVPADLAELVERLDLGSSTNKELRIPRWKDVARCRNLSKLSVINTDFSLRRHGHFLNALYGLGNVSLSNQNQDDINSAEELKYVDSLLLRAPDVVDIAAVGTLKNLRKLKIYLDSVRTIEPLSKLVDLEALSLAAARVTDVRPLGTLTKLRSLVLTVERARDVSQLAGMTELRLLSVQSRSLGEIDFVGRMGLLESLKLQSSQSSQIRAVAGLSLLKSLSLQVNRVHDLSPIGELVNLQMLALEANSAESVKPLRKLRCLSSLTLQANSAVDVDTIADLGQLTRLVLATSKAPELTWLRSLNQLRTLTIQANAIQDIGFIDALRSLESLTLQATSLRSGFSSLARLPKLSKLDITALDWTWFRKLSGSSSLEHLTLSGRGVVDLAPLASIESLRTLRLNSIEATNAHLLVGVNILHS